jgi:hypothetical protein
MNRFVYKILNVVIMTFLSCSVIAGGMFFTACFLAFCVFLYKGNMNKVYEFLPPAIITPFALLLCFKIGNIWRAKTINFRDEDDKTWMD